tara:strand:- start:14785 stop:16182 length:1398 start_codon:yes stop_codon:yes gene_type:complete
MKISIKKTAMLALFIALISCEDFLEVDTPDHKVVSEVVFNNEETALSAMTGIYNQLYITAFSNGGFDSVTVLSGLSADDLTTIRTTNLSYIEFDQHEIQPTNSRNLNLWTSAYKIIYMTNSLLEGLDNSENISEEIRIRLEGEAKFVRAFTYFYLVNLYGDVPMILTTDYKLNALAKRESVDSIYQLIIEDLQTASDVLGNDYYLGERTQVNRNTAMAMLARAHLYMKNWEQAEFLSSQLIENDEKFEILEDLDEVFLANSKEAIWQLSPLGGGTYFTNTNEGSNFIIHPFFTVLSHLKLNEDFVSSFSSEDKRSIQWVNFHSGLSVYYPFKYKIKNSTDAISEYSMMLRLAEQYLIRAEARAMQDNLVGAIADLDVIRKRADLKLVGDTNSDIGKEDLLNLILEERKKEMFSEWGHRWLDLKRTKKADEVIGTQNPEWQDTDVLYPIPESERLKNPNLTQNDGY